MRKQSFEKLLRDAVRKDAEAQGNLLHPETEPIPAASQARFETALYGKQKAKPNTSASTAAVPVESQSARPQKRFSRVLGYGMAAAAIACIVGLVFGVGLFRGSKKGEGAPSEPMAELNDTHEPKPQEVPPQTTDAPVLPTEQEPPATSEPGPAPGGMPLTPVEELPEIQTEAFTWNGYRCLMIAEYDVLYDVPNIIMFLPKNEEVAKDLPSIVYGLRPEEAFDDWDATPLREQIDVVLNNTGSGDSDENSVLHSARTVYPNVVCRHVEYDDGYLCYTKVGTDGTKGLILYGLAATETGIDLYDRLVYAFIQMNGYPAKPTGRTEQTAQMRAFFEQNRELLESARTKNPGYYPDLMIDEDGRGSYQRPYEDMRAVVEITKLPSELQVLAARAKEKGVTIYWEGRLLRYEPGHPFAKDSEPCFVVTMPESRDEAQSAYEVWLIHTENAQEQFAEAYRDVIEPLWGDWYLYVLYREAEGLFGVWDTDDVPFLYLELSANGAARLLEFRGDADVRMQYARNADGQTVRLTFSDQTIVKTAQWTPNSDRMTLTLADGTTHTATLQQEIVLPLQTADAAVICNPVGLPICCPASALGKVREGVLFRHDLDGDGTQETISFRQSSEDGDTPVIVCIDEAEYPLTELEPRDTVDQAILYKPDPASDDLALVVTTQDFMADWNETAILLLHGREVRQVKAETNDAYAYLQDGTLRITARCWLIGTYYGSRVYAGAELEPASEWYETGVLDRVRDRTREEQIEFNNLFEVVRDLPCTIDGEPAVIEAGTWVYLLRWKDTDDCAEIMTEDGTIAQITFTTDYDAERDYIRGYFIDGVDAESYFDNLNMAG
jgi:hypothetical protein